MDSSPLPPIPELFEGLDIRSIKLEEWYQKLCRQPVHSVHQKQILEVMEHYRKMSRGIDVPPFEDQFLNHPLRYRDWDGEPMHLWEWLFKKEWLPPDSARGKKEVE